MSAERPILIVDDDEALRETLAEQLAVDGEFTATEAGSVREAEERLNSKDCPVRRADPGRRACRTATAATSAPGCGGRGRRCRSSC